MDTDSESDHDSPSAIEDDLGISEFQAKHNYEEAGKLIEEEKDPISLEKHSELINSSCAAVLEEVVRDLALPYSLSDFQKLSVNIMMQKKDLVLLSPTGSGKEC